MKPQQYGLIHYDHELRYFTSYKIVKEKQGEHIEATLVGGKIITVYPYWSKKRGRMVEARKAIYRLPSILTGEEK